MRLKEELIKIVGKKKEEAIEKMGFEIIGDIAIVDIGLESDDLKCIAEGIKRLHPNIGVVVKKVEDVQGKYRIAKYEVIATYNRSNFMIKLPKRLRNLSSYETIHHEHGCRFLLNINEVYFSSKLGFERKRIAEQVKDGEEVAVLFAGVGPFAIVIAKYKTVAIDAVEINDKAIEYFNKNIELNKLKGTVTIYHDDVSEWIKKHDLKQYDRIVMPAPKDAPTYLDQILKKARADTIIHYYFFVDKKDIDGIKEMIERQYGVEVLYGRIAGSVSTNKFRYVVDMKKII